jgi:site-specific DNA-methyltransferase (adenine-specific)
MNNIVFNQDCMEGMKNYPDKNWHLAPVDPPYFSGPDKLGYYGSQLSPAGVHREAYEKVGTWSLPDEKYFQELKRVSENQIIWGANYYDFIGTPFKTPRGEEIHQWIKENPTGWIVWDKCNGHSSFNDYELAWTSFDRPTVIFKYMWNGMMQGKSIREGHLQQGNKRLNEKRIHPTQKPKNLYIWLLLEYAVAGQKILDTHVGSGSSRLACYDLGFDFTGFEIGSNYWEKQEQRFQKETAQLNFLIGA